MFDTNIFDRLSEFYEELKASTDHYEYYVTTVQVEELCEIPDSKIEIRKKNILRLADLRAKLVPISLIILNGRAKFDFAKFGDGEVYKNVLNENKSNTDDAIIADTSVSEGCVLITEDKKLYQKMKEKNYNVLNLEEFLNDLKTKC